MNELQELQSQRELGRAKNAVQSFFIRKLLVPKIYLDTDWDGWKVDVLGIDRAGVGDVHAVRLVSWEAGHTDNHGWSSFLERAVDSEVPNFAEFPGHFRYLAIVCSEPNKRTWIPSTGIKNQSLAADGVGRLGILYVNITDEDSEVEVLLKAERFRSSKKIVELADRFVAGHTPNWEVRDEPGFE
jgi:hypothetical protein